MNVEIEIPSLLQGKMNENVIDDPAPILESIHEERKILELERKKFDEEKAKFLKFKLEHSEVERQKKLNEDIIEINVGGIVFTTLQSTLQKHENSYLSTLISEKETLPRDKYGRIYLDRNGKVFSLILEYLRTGSLPIVFATPMDENSFNREVEFFRLKLCSVPFSAIWNPHLKSAGLTINDDGKMIEVVGEDADHIAILGGILEPKVNTGVSLKKGGTGGGGILGKEALENGKITRGTVCVSIQVVIPRPNRYAVGVLPEIPVNFSRGFAYKNGVNGWGLHDHSGSKGIFCLSSLVAEATAGYVTNDIVTVIVDVDRGNLLFKVNGVKCAELLGCESIKLGVYIAVSLFNKGAVWRIVT